MLDWFFVKPKRRKASETQAPEDQSRLAKNDNIRTAPAGEIPYPILRELIHPVVRGIMK